MESYTLIVVGDERAPMRRFQVPRTRVRRAIWSAVALVAALLITGAHYAYTLKENRALANFRVEATAQRVEIDGFLVTLAQLEQELAAVRELERKVRIIANLPGAAASGGVEVTERAIPTHGRPADDETLLRPAGVPSLPPAADAAPPQQPLSQTQTQDARSDRPDLSGVERLKHMDANALELDSGASEQTLTLTDLLRQLEKKHNRLVSMPSVWPTRGWLTSRFGKRISPFTGRAHKHSGIDIAAETGTPVVAPGHARVSFVGRRGPLGQSVVLDHGFGVRTVYGHNSAIHVKIGDEVDRGQLLASVGSTGRSTGPHLHYTVEVNGKAHDPLDYIFD
jgi:murein DD-endopeptidase MepM/ murein hydrolase activator NlpD